jgi:hypothetical protein
MADAIVRARDVVVELAVRCTEEQWRERPLDGDSRPVGVVIDHVADAYTYLAVWVRQLLDGETVNIDADVVDALNAQHAGEALNRPSGVVIDHLRATGDEFATLIRRLSDADLEVGDGRVGRLAIIAARHAVDHAAEIAAALAVGSKAPL